jgi:hypothetical protein
VKLFGPVHAYVAPVTAGVLSVIVDPAQKGPPFDAAGVAGIGFTVTCVTADVFEQPLIVTWTA